MGWTAPVASARGQATVETVALLPLLVAIALGVAQLLAAGLAYELADHAAEAGAVALLQGGDPADAARRAIPGWAHDRVSVEVRDRRVDVAVRPPSPFAAVSAALTARATGDAGAAR